MKIQVCPDDDITRRLRNKLRLAETLNLLKQKSNIALSASLELSYCQIVKNPTNTALVSQKGDVTIGM